MREIFRLFRAYMQGTKPFEQLLGGAKRKGVRILAILAMVYGFCVLSVMLGFSYASYQQAGRMAGHPEWGFPWRCSLRSSSLSLPSCFPLRRCFPQLGTCRW